MAGGRSSPTCEWSSSPPEVGGTEVEKPGTADGPRLRSIAVRPWSTGLRDVLLAVLMAGSLTACRLSPVPEPGLTAAAGFASPRHDNTLAGGMLKVDGLTLAERVGGTLSVLRGTYGFEAQAEATVLRAQAALYGTTPVAGMPDLELPGYVALGLGPARVRDGGEEFDAAYLDVEFGLVDGLHGEQSLASGLFVATTWSFLLVDDDGRLEDDSIFEALIWFGYRLSL